MFHVKHMRKGIMFTIYWWGVYAQFTISNPKFSINVQWIMIIESLEI